MTKKHFIFAFFVLIMCFCVLIGYKIFLNKNPKKDIQSILSTDAYSYLPVEAKDYIEEVYNTTGEVVLTEKNKQDNEYYLNPEYITYLISEDKNLYEDIPSELITDYVYQGISTDNNIPSSFDLRNVNGKNYITPLKNQGSYGLCWSFATMEQAESYLLVKEGKSYKSGETKLFSPRHADYATAKDAIIETKSSYTLGRELTSGGNFQYILPLAMDGLSYVPEDWIAYNSAITQLEYSRVYNYNNTIYELNETINVPSANLRTADPAYRTEFLNQVKSAIMRYGGAYVSTSSPRGNCSVSYNGTRLIYADGSCSGTGHGMQIIGWDDNLEYNLCVQSKNSAGNYVISTNTGSCNGTVVNSKGAWLLRNSWGNSTPYLYLAYDSSGTTIKIAKDISEKTWDNQYRGIGNAVTSNSKKVTKTIPRKAVQPEILDKIKIDLLTQNETYYFYVSRTDNINDKEYLGSIYTDMPGIYSFDASSKNIELSNPTFIIYVYSTDGKLSSTYMNVYTKNVQDAPEIKTSDIDLYNNFTYSVFRTRVSADVTGIPDGNFVQFKITDQNGQEINSYYNYVNNMVASGKIYALLYIDSTLEKGNYKLQTIYDGNVLSTSNINVKQNKVTLLGSGTKTSPFLIYNAEDLDAVRSSATAYYKLMNDIDLTYDTQDPNGMYYNDGKGWEPLFSGSIKSISSTITTNTTPFTGGFDGNNHRITGLYINRPNEKYVGLFSALVNTYNQDSYIKNLILEDANITGGDYVGGIAGAISGYSDGNCLSLENLSLLDGSIKGSNYVAGISGYLEGGGTLKGGCTDTNKERFSVYNLFNSATIQGSDFAAGIFAHVINYNYVANTRLKIHDIQNVGLITSNDDAGGLISWIKSKNNAIIEITNAINTGPVKSSNSYGIYSYYVNTTKTSYVSLNNVFYISEEGAPSDTYQATNFQKVGVLDLINMDKWSQFDNYWTRDKVDGIMRIPILKTISNRFQYTSIGVNSITIDIDQNETKNINDYIYPPTEIGKNIRYGYDNDIIEIDENGTINGLKNGSTILTILSLYDGYQSSLTINIHKSPIITYYSNFGDENYTQLLVDGHGKLYANTFERPGHRFVKWNTKEDGTGTNYANESVVNLTDDISLYAVWEEITHSVVFHSNGGTSVAAQNVIEGLKVLLPSLMPEKEGYVFDGWYTDPDLTILFDQTQPVMSDLDLYAKWQPKNYVVTFVTNGGELSDSTKIVYYQSSYGALPTPVRSMYVFKGWYKDSSFTIPVNKDTIYDSLTDTSLYAKWEISSFDINDMIDYQLKAGAISISDETKASDFVVKDGFTYSIHNHDGVVKDSELIATGDTVRFYVDNNKVLECDIVVFGDINGDGKISTIDSVLMRKHIMDVRILEGIYALAGDMNDDNKVSTMDRVRIIKYIMAK